jgi:hypothetical protein
MSPLAIATIVLACVFGGSLVGLFLRNLLPGHHLQEDSKDIVKLGTGVIATMAALVLGLLVSSAKDSFDKTSTEITNAAAKIVQLDRALAEYGGEAAELRSTLRTNFRAMVDVLVTADKSGLARLRAPGTANRAEDLETAIRRLVPQSDAQRGLHARALALAEDASAYRTLLLLQQHDSISVPLLVVVVAWLALIFVGFGLFSPRNGTVIAALFLCALSVSGAVFLILEMDHPLDGMVRISEAPLQNALAILTSR